MKKLPQNKVSKEKYLQTKGRSGESRGSGPITQNKASLQFADFDSYKRHILLKLSSVILSLNLPRQLVEPSCPL